MAIDWSALADAVVEDLEATGEAFIDKLDADQRPILIKAARDIAEATGQLITDAENEEVHKETIEFAKGTLLVESTLTALRAEKRIRAAVESALTRLAAVGLSLL